MESMNNEKKYFLRNLISCARQGDMDAINKLIEHYLPVVGKVASRLQCSNNEDVLQDGYVRLVEAIDHLLIDTDKVHICGNIYSAVNNAVLNSKNGNEQSCSFYGLRPASTEILTEEQIFGEIIVESIIDGCDLVDTRSDCFKQRIIHQKTNKQISDEYGVSHQAVSQRFRLSLPKVKAKVLDTYF